MIFLIVGPSGSGKDTLIDYAVNHLPVKKAKRVITRENNDFEDFTSVTPEEFNKMKFFIKWEAHGNKYGIPELSEGHYLINASRTIINKVKKLRPDTKVIELIASKEVLLTRHLARSRDSKKTINERINRELSINSDLVIDSSSPDINIAGNKLVNYLRKQLLLN